MNEVTAIDELIGRYRNFADKKTALKKLAGEEDCSEEELTERLLAGGG